MRETPRRRDRAAAAALALLAALLLAPPAAPAETEREVSHPFQRVWPTAVRFLRIDAGFELLEKDADAGYVLFELDEDNETFRGSLELVRTRDRKRRPAVRLILRIQDRPDYVERVHMDHLLRKIRDEHGRPPPPPPEKEEDGGEGDGEDGEGGEEGGDGEGGGDGGRDRGGRT